ncbi:LysR family transcriptional regulator [Marinobacterium sedimentorum]|uniref:LysR family transcriptional regulator n=1 Tax=Marinobacterium sedimentorum TaxID=2927804 RepID=UPI0020C6B8D6|nr:LysR family transcriptional regulator [Marinobacterium sedimentorum]MCP8687189.1 LysR family transcriptional regulator [Marinobacterium sedimentorum]
MSINVRFDLRHLKAFMAVAELLHFKKAAEALFITQPALSRLIKNLENEVKAELFARTTRQVALTEAGRLLQDECRLAFSHIERGVHLAQRAAEGDIGHITIAYNDFSINGNLPRILEAFKEKFPQVAVELSYIPSHLQHEALRDCQIDIGFLIGPSEDDCIESLLVDREKTVVILPVKHPLAQRKTIRLKELADEKFIIGSEGGWQAFRAHIFTICQKAGFIPQIIQEASTSNGIFGLVAANMGISLYAECVKNFTRRDIVVVPLEEDQSIIETVAAWNTAYESPSARRFKELLKQAL